MKKIKKLLTSFFILTLLISVIMPVAFATTGQAILKPGSLNIDSPATLSDFGGGSPITLSGVTQTVAATLSNWAISDATGSAKGWYVTVQATQLTQINGAGLKLPLNSITLSGVRSIMAGPGSTAVSTTNGPLFKSITSSIDTTTPTQIINTQVNYGKGKYTISEPTDGLKLTLVPDTTVLDAKENTVFTTTITYSVISGP
jgi:hypothetical protein